MLYTRRDIGKLAIGAIALPRLFERDTLAAAQFNGVRIGVITYSFRGMSDAEAIFAAMKTIGFNTVELMSNHAEQLAGAPSVPFDLHVAPPPLVEGASRPRPILSWAGIAVPATAAANREAVDAFLEYASQPGIDRSIVEGLQVYSPIAASNGAITNEVAQEFLPMFENAITPLDWLWEPEITAEIDSQVQGLVKGATDPRSAAQAVEAVAQGLHASGRSYYP